MVLKNRGILYAPSFVANAGGLIQLAGTHLGMTRQEIDGKIDKIEATTAHVLREAEGFPSTYAAAVALANLRIAQGTSGAKEKVHAG